MRLRDHSFASARAVLRCEFRAERRHLRVQRTASSAPTAASSSAASTTAATRVINRHEKFVSRIGLHMEFLPLTQEEVLTNVLPALILPPMPGLPNGYYL